MSATDQASAVDAEQAFLDALGPSVDEEKEEDQPESEEQPEEGEPEPEPEATEETPELFKITVKNDAGDDEEKDVSLDELAKGYMLQADYSRKTQAVAKEKQEAEAKFHQDLTKVQQSAIDRIDQLQGLVLKQAAPELASVDWVSLSVQDPAEFVRLKARQEQMTATYHQLEQEKAQLSQAQQQTINQQVEQALKHSDDLLTKSIDGFDGPKVEKLLKAVDASLGWKPNDIKYAAAAMVKAGMRPETLGQVLLLAHKASQYDELTAKKATVLKKVVSAPKVIRPAAPQPKKSNQEALKRLQKSGRGEDFMKFL